MMLGTSDAWSTSHLSKRPIVLYCGLSNFNMYHNFWTQFGISDHSAWSGRDEEYAEE